MTRHRPHRRGAGPRRGTHGWGAEAHGRDRAGLRVGLPGRRDRDAVRIPYARSPGFPSPRVEGHKGELVAGTLGGARDRAERALSHVRGAQRRGHALPVRVFAALGIETLIVTNAAGGVRRTFAAGALMLIADHLNLIGRNPLIGPVLNRARSASPT